MGFKLSLKRDASNKTKIKMASKINQIHLREVNTHVYTDF